ncbi:VWA domain-containing protein [uncultured Paludibaculum sp.]|uniref:VWA domain-containing protein n=1 Tax=uncultured Paludibaculum sp. TaxID=1765020 RepID=UPI002AAB5D15|nr:VWA domain-containing protein [uncultured Paludibaculum sp.]
MEDGSVPDRMVTVQRVCYGMQQPVRESLTSRRTGEYVVRLFVNEMGQVYSGTNGYAGLPCSLEASHPGLISSRIDLTDRRITLNPRLPDIVLTPKSQSATLVIKASPTLPRAASRSWEVAVKRLTSNDWGGSEGPLRATVQAAPKFAPAWAALGGVCSRQGKMEEARRALERAVELDPKPIAPYQMLVQAQAGLKDWPAVAATCDRLFAVDTKHVFVEAYLFSATALYQLHNYDQALARIGDAIRLDRLREFKRAEYIRGIILEAKGDYAAAAQHFHSYLAENPRAKEAAAVHQRIENLGKEPPADLSEELSSLDLNLAATGEAQVPGGIKAFSAIAQLPGASGPHDFFLDYCRAITAGRPDQPNRTLEDQEAIVSFIPTIAALERVGERTERGTLIRLSTAGDIAMRRTRAMLGELGWKLVPSGEGYSLEDGVQKDGALRQRALAVLGVEELDLRTALLHRREFTFEIPRETARLVGGAAWSLLLKGVPEASGGPAEIFLRDRRFARVYSGLGSMDGESAAALVSSVGLANLIVKYSALTAAFADSVEIGGNRVMVPGGVRAEALWAKLAGAKPQAIAPFLRGLFEKDQGRLLAFYHHLAHADARRQQFFTQTPERAEAFYKWYRDTAPVPGSILASKGWHEKFLQSLPIDATGRVLFPGGRAAWGKDSETDDEILLRHAPLEALGAIALLEQQRGTPLSGPAAQVLARNYGEWHHLFGYFEKLPALDEPAFRTLEEFAAQAAKTPEPERNLLLGEWHSLVQIIVLGSQAGSLTASQAGQAFQQVCVALRPPNPSAGALAALRSIAGGAPDLDEALISRLLHLTGRRRAAFEELRKLQDIPRLTGLAPEPGSSATLHALSGAVYAAMLDPGYLLAAEDQQLLRKHRFVPGGSAPRMFPPSLLRISSGPSGSYFEGGFASFEEAAQPLRGRAAGAQLVEAEPATVAPAAEAGLRHEVSGRTDTVLAGDADLVFQARGRVVEAYATVTDSHGRYADDLNSGQFTILEEGESKPVFAFESRMAGVSVALVFDTSGSMVSTLPKLKSAALQLLDDLRPVDSAAVYTFDDTVTALVPFAEDKEAAKRAILKLHACGVTALYEALVRVNHDLAARAGKKAIIVFTDGADNASMLSARLAIEKAKQRGVPIFTIAQGEAVFHPELVSELNNIAQSTGGVPFLIHKPGEIAEVFEKISQDLAHGYLVAFQPSSGEHRGWRKINVEVKGAKGLQVRARQGYYAE